MYYDVLFAIEIIILRGFNREVCRTKKIVEEIGYSKVIKTFTFVFAKPPFSFDLCQVHEVRSCRAQQDWAYKFPDRIGIIRTLKFKPTKYGLLIFLK